MLVHIVMFKFKEENKKANIIQAKQMLDNLMGAIPSLRSIDVGVNFIESDRAMDLSLIAVFETKEGLELYDAHPEHQKVVTFIKSVVEYSKASDYMRD
ncbi:MAG TPA: Dabb family protein [Sulfurovum sp.]|nr:Dabb family protein [Sulfurovum sp.]